MRRRSLAVLGQLSCASNLTWLTVTRQNATCMQACQGRDNPHKQTVAFSSKANGLSSSPSLCFDCGMRLSYRRTWRHTRAMKGEEEGTVKLYSQDRAETLMRRADQTVGRTQPGVRSLGQFVTSIGATAFRRATAARRDGDHLKPMARLTRTLVVLCVAIAVQSGALALDQTDRAALSIEVSCNTNIRSTQFLDLTVHTTSPAGSVDSLQIASLGAHNATQGMNATVNIALSIAARPNMSLLLFGRNWRLPRRKYRKCITPTRCLYRPCRCDLTLYSQSIPESIMFVILFANTCANAAECHPTAAKSRQYTGDRVES